jgi:hypothetical protein
MRVVSFERWFIQSMCRVCPALSVIKILRTIIKRTRAVSCVDARVMCKARVHVRNFSTAAVEVWCWSSNRRTLRYVHLYNVLVNVCDVCKAYRRSGATLGAPFKNEPPRHDLVLSTQIIARRRVRYILCLNQKLERGERAGKVENSSRWLYEPN